MAAKNKKQKETEIKPIEAEIMSENTLGIDSPEVIEAEVINVEEEQGDNHEGCQSTCSF